MQGALSGNPVGVKAHPHELVGILVRQITQEHTVDNRADPDGDTNADAERRDDAGREPGSLADSSQRQADVAGEMVECGDAACVARLFAKRWVPPKRTRAARRASASLMPRRRFSAVSISRWTWNSSSCSAASVERRKISHTRVQAERSECLGIAQASAPRTRSTALTKRFHEATSCPSARRPAAVSR